MTGFDPTKNPKPNSRDAHFNAFSFVEGRFYFLFLEGLNPPFLPLRSSNSENIEIYTFDDHWDQLCRNVTAYYETTKKLETLIEENDEARWAPPVVAVAGCCCCGC